MVAPELIGCLLVKRQAGGELLWGVIVETEAYCQSEPACHGHRRRTPGNATLFGEPGRFYVYVSYGIHHCVNVVTGCAERANGVLLRAAALPGEAERVAAGPALLARRFGLDRRQDAQPATPESGLWIAPRPGALASWCGADSGSHAPGSSPPAASEIRPASDGEIATIGEAAPGHRPLALTTSIAIANAASPDPPALMQTQRIGISQGQALPWRWYLRASRAVSRRAPGDRRPRFDALVELLASGESASTVGMPS